MKIIRVELFDIKMKADIRVSWYPVLIRIHKDEGLYGVGQVGLARSPHPPLPHTRNRQR